MRRREKRPITINVYLPDNVQGNVNLITEGMDEIMAKIDEVQASFDELDAAVRDFLAQGTPAVDAIQAELDALRADDAVEDTKLDGLKNGIQNLTGAVNALRNVADGGGGGDQPHPDQTLPGDLPAQ